MLSVNGKQAIVRVPGLKIAHASNVTAFCCATIDKPASALVDNMLFKWTNHDEKPLVKQQDVVTFNLPRKEMKLVLEAKHEASQIAEWRKFDSFFGFFLLLNGASIGVQVELNQRMPGQIAASTWRRLENAFLLIFTIELMLRFWIMGRGLCKQFDWWVVFDSVVVFLGYFMLILESIPFPVSVMRLLRLLKLAKMVRLVRAFKALGILVEA
jgi:hypothetical protein